MRGIGEVSGEELIRRIRELEVRVADYELERAFVECRVSQLLTRVDTGDSPPLRCPGGHDVASLVVDKDARIHWVSDRAALLLGIDRFTVRGCPSSVCLPRELAEFLASAVRRAVERDGEKNDEWTTVLQGRSVVLDALVRPVHGEDRSVSAAMVFLRESATEEKPGGVGDERRPVRGDHAPAVCEIVAGFTHGINNLIGAVQGYGELIGSGLGGDASGEDQIRRVTAMVETSSMLIERVALLQRFARRARSSEEWCDVDRTLRELVPVLHHGLGLEVSLECTPAPSARLVRMSPFMMAELIAELVCGVRSSVVNGGCLSLQVAEKRAGTGGGGGSVRRRAVVIRSVYQRSRATVPSEANEWWVEKVRDLVEYAHGHVEFDREAAHPGICIVLPARDGGRE